METDAERAALAATMERHADEEGRILANYRALAEQLGDSALTVLVDHILTEEEMHHLLLRTMARWLREPGARPVAAVPSQAQAEALLRLTRELQQHERETIEACRRLRAQLSARSGELEQCLLDAMVLDSEKHHRLLRAVVEILATRT